MTGMVPPFSTSCADHTGHSGGWMLEWDGEQFVEGVRPAAAETEVISAAGEGEGAGIRGGQRALAGERRAATWSG